MILGTPDATREGREIDRWIKRPLMRKKRSEFRDVWPGLAWPGLVPSVEIFRDFVLSLDWPPWFAIK